MPSKLQKLGQKRKPMRNIKLTLEYNGSSFHGFQKQPRHKTIQSELERSLSKLLNQKMKIVAASGRTDTGVHALGQVVNFKTAKELPLPKLQQGLNHYLPRPIVVKEIKEEKDNFHARYDAKSKVYEYWVWNGKARSPVYSDYSYHVPYALNLSKMKKGAKLFEGKHDFKAFCASGSTVSDDKQRGFRRTIKRFTVKKEGQIIRFTVEADGFLYHMVRNLVGTLLEVGQGRGDLDDLRVILRSRDRKNAGPTAPPQGLFLKSVTY